MPVSEDYLIFEDTETSGLKPGEDEVCEIASILTDLDMNEISRFHKKIRLIDPSVMKRDAAQVNGYDPVIWSKEAVPFMEYQLWLKSQIPFGSVAIAIGHNAKFDRDIIEQKYYKPYAQFFPWSYRVIDTAGLAMAMKVAKVIDVPNVKLETVVQALKIQTNGFHRAMSDCEASKKIFEFTVGMFKS